MATFILFDSFKEKMLLGSGNLEVSIAAFLLSGTAAVNIDTSTIASVTARTLVTGMEGATSLRQLGAGTITKSADNAFKFDVADFVFTATAGSQFTAGVCLITRAVGAAATASHTPVGYFKLSTGEVVATQLTISVPASGLFETSANAP